MPTELACRNLTFGYPARAHPSAELLLQGIEAIFPGGQVVLISGRSGVGKSTLLHLLAGLRRPSSGEILADGQPVSRWLTAHRDRWRRRVGIIFQQDYLVSDLTVLENVMLPLIPRSGGPNHWRTCAQAILARLNAGDLAPEPVTTLSGGQRLRVAAARGIIYTPYFVVAVQPAAHQFIKHARRLGRLLRQAAFGGAVVLVAAHDRHVDDWLEVDQHLMLDNGTLKPAP